MDTKLLTDDIDESLLRLRGLSDNAASSPTWDDSISLSDDKDGHLYGRNPTESLPDASCRSVLTVNGI